MSDTRIAQEAGSSTPAGSSASERRLSAVPGREAGRDRTMDVARGVAIFAVVVGHVLRGLSGSGIVDGSDRTEQLADTGLYSFHVAVFVLLAALFVPRSIERRGTATYLRDRILLLAYLYVIWSILQGGVEVITSGVKNSATTWTDVFSLWHPRAQFWFLPFMILATVVAAVARPWRSRPHAVVAVLAGLAVTVALWGRDASLVGLVGLPLLGAFLIGSAIGSERLTRLTRRIGTPAAAGAGALLTAGFLILLPHGIEPPTVDLVGWGVSTTLRSLLESVVGITAVLAWSVVMARIEPVAMVLGLLGRRSLEIYLGHITFASGTRVILTHLGVDSWVVHLVLGTAAGIGCALVLAVVVRRLRWRWVFGLPFDLGRPAATSRA